MNKIKSILRNSTWYPFLAGILVIPIAIKFWLPIKDVVTFWNESVLQRTVNVIPWGIIALSLFLRKRTILSIAFAVLGALRLFCSMVPALVTGYYSYAGTQILLLVLRDLFAIAAYFSAAILCVSPINTYYQRYSRRIPLLLHLLRNWYAPSLLYLLSKGMLWIHFVIHQEDRFIKFVQTNSTTLLRELSFDLIMLLALLLTARWAISALPKSDNNGQNANS